MKKIYFVVGALSALTFASFANLPRSGSTSGSMATQSDVSEIRAKRHADLSFDSDLQRLASIQSRYHENLPLRVSKKSHKPVHVKVKAKGRL